MKKTSNAQTVVYMDIESTQTAEEILADREKKNNDKANAMDTSLDMDNAPTQYGSALLDLGNEGTIAFECEEEGGRITPSTGFHKKKDAKAALSLQVDGAADSEEGEEFNETQDLLVQVDGPPDDRKSVARTHSCKNTSQMKNAPQSATQNILQPDTPITNAATGSNRFIYPGRIRTTQAAVAQPHRGPAPQHRMMGHNVSINQAIFKYSC